MNEQQEYYVISANPVGGILHNESGFCDDMRHECHENAASIEELNQAIQNGSATPDDPLVSFADRRCKGRGVRP